MRDVQSALKAQWDIAVDRRKVSVAQVQAAVPESLGRLRYAGLEIKTDTRSGKSEISVTLERAQGDQTSVYVGKARADATETSTLFGIAKATCLAVNLTIEPPNAFFVDDVSVVKIGLKEAVAVLVGLVTPKHNHEELLGAALVRREVREACVRATLDAMNRRLEVLPQRGSLGKGGKKEHPIGTEEGEELREDVENEAQDMSAVPAETHVESGSQTLKPQ